MDGLWSLKKLESLKLQGNPIGLPGLSLAGLAQLSGLRALYCQNFDHSNPCPACCEPGYKGKVLAVLSGLGNLDGER